MKLLLLLAISFNLFASSVKVKTGETSYEFELLISELNPNEIDGSVQEKLKQIDLTTSKLDKKNKLFFFKNSIYKSVLHNSIFNNSRESITLKEFLRTLNKYNEKQGDYSAFSNWIIESILVEYKDLEKASTPEEFRLIARSPEIARTMRFTSNLVLDFLNLDAKEFLKKVNKLAFHVVNSLYHDALIIEQTVKLKLSKPSINIEFIKDQTAVKKEKDGKETKKEKKEFLPSVDPSTAIDNLDISEEENWKPKN